MATIYLYKFNNYYNRQVKKFDTLEEYGEYAYVETGNNANFNPNDGVNTQHVFGRQNNPYAGDCDYLIYCQDNINITSRWFITEQVRKLTGQYNLMLRRDVMVDNYDAIVSAPCFIEKATLRDDDVLIYNKEGVEVNQIKQPEVLLKDDTDVAWICGYIPRDYAGGNLTFSADNVADIEVDDLEDWEFYDSIGVDVYKGSKPASLYIKSTVNGSDHYYIELSSSRGAIWNWNSVSLSTQPNSPDVTATFSGSIFKTVATLKREIVDYYNSTANANITMVPYFNAYWKENFNGTLYNNLNSLEGKIIKAGDRHYKIRTTRRNTNVRAEVLEDKPSAPLYSNLKDTISSNPKFKEWWSSSLLSAVNYMEAFLTQTADIISIDLEELPSGEYKIEMPGVVDRYHLKDAPYDMFCIPYAVEKDSVKVKNTGDSAFAELTMSPSLAMSIAQGIAEQIGQQNIYDLQLLPFCPMTGFDLSKAKSENLIDIKATDSRRYTMVTNTAATPVNKAVILWSLASQRTFSIDREIVVENKKIENQTDKYRIVSPNYSGVFEFSAAYNNGVDKFNVDYTYLPYNPYIHVNPYFKGLYGNGEDYEDARGLICQGDFSISYLSDAWANYQVQNKNYLNIFARGTQNMETNNKITNIQGWASAGAGAIQGAAAGALVRGPIGAAIGGALSAGAGAVDMHYAKKLQNEALDYREDLFGYNLQNIQALPDSIARTTAYTANNKVFPILEYYTCKDQEKEILANKIAWNGMTVMAIGTIGDYINNSWQYGEIEDKGYIKGQLIRLEELHDDTHTLNAIAEEINKGGYFK